MTVDREQVRRDARQQAEIIARLTQERDEARRQLEEHGKVAEATWRAYEAQLVVVPALVEWIEKQARHHHRSFAHSRSFEKCEFPICQSGRDALAKWEQAQGETP